MDKYNFIKFCFENNVKCVFCQLQLQKMTIFISTFFASSFKWISYLSLFSSHLYKIDLNVIISYVQCESDVIRHCKRTWNLSWHFWTLQSSERFKVNFAIWSILKVILFLFHFFHLKEVHFFFSFFFFDMPYSVNIWWKTLWTCMPNISGWVLFYYTLWTWYSDLRSH